jgi:hypothetical protein
MFIFARKKNVINAFLIFVAARESMLKQKTDIMSIAQYVKI